MTSHSSTVEFDEFDRVGKVVSLSSEGAHALAQTELVEVSPAGRGRWRIVPNGKVGSVRVEDLAIRVMPSADLGLTQLFFLLDHAPEEAFLASAISAKDDDEVWTAVADSLASLANEALTAGLLRGYRRVEEALPTVRGRIRMGEQIRRRPGQMLPLEVVYSEFTPNVPENRIVRTAAHRLQFLPTLSDSTRRRLNIVSARLADASVIPMGAQIPQWTPTRLNARYQDVLRLADRIVRSMSVEVDDGKARTAAFVTEMPGLFSSFVTSELNQALSASGGKVLDNPVVNLDSGPMIAGRHREADPADHISVGTGQVYEVDGRPVTTFITGYPKQGKTPAAEHYRLLAACTALGVDRAYLVYPAQRGQIEPTPRKIVHTNISLVEYPIDLSAGPELCRQRIQELAAEARSLATSALPSRG